MRTVFLVLLLAAAAAVGGAIRSADIESVSAALPTGVNVPSPTPAASPTPALQQPPTVTVRVGQGRDKVGIGRGEYERGRKGRVQSPGLGRDPDHPANTSLVVDGQGVSLADEGDSGEGRLTRIHVDADEDLTAVIGFYSTIDADRPVNDPNTYGCKKCGSVLVCGVDPQCGE